MILDRKVVIYPTEPSQYRDLYLPIKQQVKILNNRLHE